MKVLTWFTCGILLGMAIHANAGDESAKSVFGQGATDLTKSDCAMIELNRVHFEGGSCHGPPHDGSKCFVEFTLNGAKKKVSYSDNTRVLPECFPTDLTSSSPAKRLRLPPKCYFIIEFENTNPNKKQDLQCKCEDSVCQAESTYDDNNQIIVDPPETTGARQ